MRFLCQVFLEGIKSPRALISNLKLLPVFGEFHELLVNSVLLSMSKLLKGTVSRDFLHLVFFINQFILVPLEMSLGRFDFFCLLAEL